MVKRDERNESETEVSSPWKSQVSFGEDWTELS